MAVFICVECGQLRARRGESVYSVCFLIACLAEEHAADEHERPNASCVACTAGEAYALELRRHWDAMRCSGDTQEAMRARRFALYGDGSLTGRLSTNKPMMQVVRPVSSGHMDHSQCDHERTAKARAACRRACTSGKITS